MSHIIIVNKNVSTYGATTFYFEFQEEVNKWGWFKGLLGNNIFNTFTPNRATYLPFPFSRYTLTKKKKTMNRTWTAWPHKCWCFGSVMMGNHHSNLTVPKAAKVLIQERERSSPFIFQRSLKSGYATSEFSEPAKENLSVHHLYDNLWLWQEM